MSPATRCKLGRNPASIIKVWFWFATNVWEKLKCSNIRTMLLVRWKITTKLLKTSHSLSVYNRGNRVCFVPNLRTNSSKSIFLVFDFSKASSTRLHCRPWVIERLRWVSICATKQQNALTNRDTAPKSGYSCSKFIHIKQAVLAFVRKVYAAKCHSPSIYFVGHRVGEEYERRWS